MRALAFCSPLFERSFRLRVFCTSRRGRRAEVPDFGSAEAPAPFTLWLELHFWLFFNVFLVGARYIPVRDFGLYGLQEFENSGG